MMSKLLKQRGITGVHNASCDKPIHYKKYILILFSTKCEISCFINRKFCTANVDPHQ